MCATGATLGVGDCPAGAAVVTGLLELLSFSARFDDAREAGAADVIDAARFSFGGLRRLGGTTLAARSLGSGTFPALG